MIILITAILLVAASICDAKSKRIPNPLLVIMLAMGIINIVFFAQNIPDKLLGLIFPSAVLLLARLFGTSIGAGDIKLISCLGLICGVGINTAVFAISCILALLIYAFNAVILKNNRISSFAFAPFIAASFVLTVTFGVIIRLVRA